MQTRETETQPETQTEPNSWPAVLARMAALAKAQEKNALALVLACLSEATEPGATLQVAATPEVLIVTHTVDAD